MGASEGRVHVNVRCELDGDFVRVTVHNINEGQSTAPAPPGTGLGLESTRERLRAAFGASASLETDSPARGQFLVRLMFAPDKAITPAMVAVS
jgi:LytS/YehU family sensor histidine kinase